MHAGTALLSMHLAVPALAARPARPVADVNAAIMARINAAEPALTQAPTPLEDLLDIAEMAERRLVAATDLGDVGELLTDVDEDLKAVQDPYRSSTRPPPACRVGGGPAMLRGSHEA